MFQTTLARLVAQAGARWAMIAGVDGVLLETDNAAFRAEAEGLAAEYAAFYRASRKATTDTDMGALKSALLVAENAKIVFQALTADYLLIVLLTQEAHSGKAFFEMSRIAEILARELTY